MTFHGTGVYPIPSIKATSRRNYSVPAYCVRYFDGLPSRSHKKDYTQNERHRIRRRNSHVSPDRMDRKEAVASKWFPYGYGPATGTSFVIEEIGEVSDGEEDYWMFEEERQQFSRKPTPTKVRSWFDDYQTSRDLRKSGHG
ncbi:hypothetical protein BKA61DRAFT_570312 [Leptodontidium sp. MPI-SDFR-AT-0119]|nr:hypothetical protein BKA61DRAFT_570312 [Leptodontidium sp. MPI-SDFR-AT-0119]